MDAGNKAREL